jgi:hypothetical protein
MGCLLLYVYFSSGACRALGFGDAVPRRALVAMYGQASVPPAGWTRAGVAGACAALAIMVEAMAMSVLAGGADPDGTPIHALVDGELAAAFAWTVYLAIRLAMIGRRAS